MADCGNGLFADVTTAVLDSVWGLVLVTDTSLDGAKKAATALDWLRVHGYHDLLTRTVVVINHREAQRAMVDIDDVKSQFAEHVGRTTSSRCLSTPMFTKGLRSTSASSTEQ